MASTPQFLEPMKCRLLAELPKGPDWVYEIKFDGVRVLALKHKRAVELYSRNHKEVSAKYPSVAAAIGKLKCGDATVDGEVVALDSAGRPSFQLLQSRNLPGAAPAPLFYYAFDLVHLNGKSLLNLSLLERRRLLEAILPVSPTIRLSSLLQSPPRAIIKKITELGFEGIIAKRIDSKYEAGRRSGSWVKYKVTNEQEFVIGGYTAPEGARSRFGALLIGYFDASQFKFASKVGTGFNGQTLEDLYRRFQHLKIAECPFANLPEPPTISGRGGLTARAMKTCTWIRPSLVCQVRFGEWTRDAHLRHPVYLGLREDKRAQDVRREVPDDDRPGLQRHEFR